MKKIVLFFMSLFLIHSFSQAQGWIELGSGVNALNANGPINSVVTDNSGNVYAAGGFTNANGKYYVAMWNGTSWTELGAGSSPLNANNIIQALTVDGSNNIYAGGNFTDSNGKQYVAKWNGSSWSALGSGSTALNENGYIYTIAVDGSGNVYVAGNMSSYPSSFLAHVSQWNGSNWTTLNLSGIYPPVYAMALDYSGDLFVGAYSDNNGYENVGEWNGSTWSALGGASNTNIWDTIKTVALDAYGNLFAGGFFSHVSGQNYVAKWNGTSWSQLGTGTSALNANGGIFTLTTDKNGNVYAAGQFTDANGKNYVSEWNGTLWSELGTGSNALNANNNINSIAVFNSAKLYAAGAFTNASNKYYVAEYALGAVTTSTTAQQKQSTITIYPNPGTGIVNLSGISENIELTVCNLLGEVVSTQQVSGGSTYVDLSTLYPGVYTLLFNGESSSYTPVKWVKE
jgi:hypothetical protein